MEKLFVSRRLSVEQLIQKVSQVVLEKYDFEIQFS